MQRRVALWVASANRPVSQPAVMVAAEVILVTDMICVSDPDHFSYGRLDGGRQQFYTDTRDLFINNIFREMLTDGAFLLRRWQRVP